ncbi:MAG: hypothetical protein A2010_02125 [Nitrospirae bacterium GWD2_57_9]|nr:MAG: hypothetical protein A2010_02125 [Nitrospirae bacterium GWD2_57_9]
MLVEMQKKPEEFDTDNSGFIIMIHTDKTRCISDNHNFVGFSVSKLPGYLLNLFSPWLFSTFLRKNQTKSYSLATVAGGMITSIARNREQEIREGRRRLRLELWTDNKGGIEHKKSRSSANRTCILR